MSGRFKPPGQCPVCGEWAPKGAVACEECGACEKSGWSGDTHADGLVLPDNDFDYDDFIAREFGGQNSPKPRTSNLWWWVALALLIAFVLSAMLPLFG
jgi:predicted nucleic acid-binding Zn ribbon protein